MNARTFIRDKKRTESLTRWANGPIPKRHFPLFKDSAIIGPAWRWRAATLASDLMDYRLLVQLRTDKPNFKAWLAARFGRDWAMIGRLESHGHAGLHCHLQCAETGIEVGLIEPVNQASIPHWKAHHRRPNEVLSETEAWNRALKFFRARAGAEAGSLGL